MSSSNTLNDDCLLEIFSYLHDFNDLINCLHVCKSWNRVVRQKLERAKYLTCSDYDDDNKLILPPNLIHLNVGNILREYQDDGKMNDPSHRFTLNYLGSHLTPNIRIISLRSFYDSRWNEKFVAHFRRATSTLKKIKSSEHLGVNLLPGEIVDNLENYKVKKEQLLDNSPNNRRYFDFVGGKLKQLACDSPIFNKYVQHLNNLRVLSIDSTVNNSELKTSDGELIFQFPHLKILIIAIAFDKRIVRVIELIRQSPRLKSIYLTIHESYPKGIYEKLEFHNVEDLVINVIPQGFQNMVNSNFFPNLLEFLQLFPSVKHFAIRWVGIRDDHVHQLVQLFPKLEIFDLRYCVYIRPSKAEWIDNYNRKNGTNIRVLIVSNFNIPKDYRSHSILRGTSFMDTYFYKQPERFPRFVDFD